MNYSQAARFFLHEKWFKSWKKAKKKGKIKRKKLQKFFCLDASTWRDEMPLIKVAYFMLNFLNLKSFLSNLFFVVAFSLSTLWCVLFIPFFIFGHFQQWSNEVIFVFILQGKMSKTKKENHATAVTKIPKTKQRKYGMNETMVNMALKWTDKKMFLPVSCVWYLELLMSIRVW